MSEPDQPDPFADDILSDEDREALRLYLTNMLAASETAAELHTAIDAYQQARRDAEHARRIKLIIWAVLLLIWVIVSTYWIFG